jgi:hypothetical protein
MVLRLRDLLLPALPPMEPEVAVVMPQVEAVAEMPRETRNYKMGARAW